MAHFYRCDLYIYIPVSWQKAITYVISIDGMSTFTWSPISFFFNFEVDNKNSVIYYGGDDEDDIHGDNRDLEIGERFRERVRIRLLKFFPVTLPEPFQLPPQSYGMTCLLKLRSVHRLLCLNPVSKLTFLEFLLVNYFYF